VASTAAVLTAAAVWVSRSAAWAVCVAAAFWVAVRMLAVARASRVAAAAWVRRRAAPAVGLSLAEVGGGGRVAAGAGGWAAQAKKRQG